MLAVLLCLIQIIKAEKFYGDMNLVDNDKKLNALWGFKNPTVFDRTDVTQDVWNNKKNKKDNKHYVHIDGSFFFTLEDGLQRWYARLTWKGFTNGAFAEITDEINNDGRESAYKRKDLVNYGIYLYAGTYNKRNILN